MKNLREIEKANHARARKPSNFISTDDDEQFMNYSINDEDMTAEMYINVNNIKGRMHAFYDYFVKSDNKEEMDDTFDESSSRQ